MAKRRFANVRIRDIFSMASAFSLTNSRRCYIIVLLSVITFTGTWFITAGPKAENGSNPFNLISPPHPVPPQGEAVHMGGSRAVLDLSSGDDGADGYYNPSLTGDSENPSGTGSRFAPPPQSSSSSVHDLGYKINNRTYCYNKPQQPKTELRGNYFVLHNHVVAEKSFNCDQSITYTTHCDHTFLDNLGPLLKRWQGPLSLAIYAPESDYDTAMRSIAYYRLCSPDANLIRDYATFHLFFDTTHMPSVKPADQTLNRVKRFAGAAQSKRRKRKNKKTSKKPKEERKAFEGVVPPAGFSDAELFALLGSDCDSFNPDIEVGEDVDTFKKANNLTYPVNVARNVARVSATTHFVFPSDIELYPSPGLIEEFLDMQRRDEDPALRSPNPKVFPNAIFEIEAGKELPETKEELIKLYNEGVVVSFHKYVCLMCHKVPDFDRWFIEEVPDKMSVFKVAKRHPPYHHWEPIFIGTNNEPFYDERLSWEGRSDKMTQGYQMCVQDYDFLILNKAFLIHRPGIKTKNAGKGANEKYRNEILKTQKLIKTHIRPELERMFGYKPGCD